MAVKDRSCVLTFDSIRVEFRRYDDKSEIVRHGGILSDLSSGTLGLSFGALNLRGRKLSSLDGLPCMHDLNILYAQDNCLQNLKTLFQPNMHSLYLQRNYIRNFINSIRQPRLQCIHLDGNPVQNIEFFQIMCCLALNPNLKRINGKSVSKSERCIINLLDRPSLVLAIQQVIVNFSWKV